MTQTSTPTIVSSPATPAMANTEASRKRRVELILRQVDALPTLPNVATRLLRLTSSDDSDAREVIELVSSDQTLTAKVLALCRQSDRGLRDDVMTVAKAVVLLGFNAIRNAVLSVTFFEAFGPGASPPGVSTQELSDGEDAGPHAAGNATFDLPAFWRHSLAVAVAAELIASAHPDQRDLHPDEAFVCGLMHDVGKLALNHVLPKSYNRVIELADLNQGNIAEFERRIIGIDHHTAGKRLAEQWQLPHILQDCIWLHGSTIESLPRLEHRRMIGLISLADLITRRQHLGYSGNFTLKQDPEELAEKLGLKPGALDNVGQKLHEELARRARVLGLDDRPSRELLVQSIQQANVALGKLNAALDRRSRAAVKQTQVLDAISAFHAQASPGRSVPDVLHSVALSAAGVLGQGFYALLCPGDSADDADPDAPKPWLMCQYNDEAKPVRSQLIEPPPDAADLTRLEPGASLSMGMMGVLPWIADYLVDARDLRAVRLLPLPCGWGTAAVLLHDRDALPPWQQLSGLAATWGAAIASAAQHDGARRLGEELAEANRALAEAQDRLLETESMARLGEMAAGAAHEMNNPLAVISGRSQLLAMTLPAGTKEQKAAQTIFEQAHRLSDLITSLRLFADPPRAQPRPTDMNVLLDTTLRRVQQEPTTPNEKPIYLQIKNQLPTMNIDSEHIGQAITELLHNALQSTPKTSIYLTAFAEPIERKLVIQVSDDGTGMDPHTLAHAMDPFFSAKKAGRRVGLGLPRAQQLVAAHSGRIDLRSTVGTGTVATITLPLDSPA